MSWSYRRLASGGLAALVVPLLLASSASASAAQEPPAGAASAQITGQYSTGVVPDVTGWDVSYAFPMVQAAGFVTQTVPGWVDCSSSPFVQFQSPAAGTWATLGSTVVLGINQQPGPGQDCP